MSERRTLLDEIQQRRPFRSASQEATLGLLRTSDVLRRFLAKVLEPAGITQQQYNVLRILRGAGEEGLPTLSIADRMVEQTPGITRLIDRLERKGWVERRRTAEDRRRVVCTLTASGLELLNQLDDPMNEADDSCLAMLTQEQQHQLIDLLDQIRAGHR